MIYFNRVNLSASLQMFLLAAPVIIVCATSRAIIETRFWQACGHAKGTLEPGVPERGMIVLHPFFVRDAIVAGSTGRIVMIIIIYGGPFIGLPNIDIISILGSVATANKQAAVTLGGAIHFMMGILFALFYALLWSLGVGSETWWWGLIFGAVHGLLVLLLLTVGMVLYPRLSRVAGRQVMFQKDLTEGVTASSPTGPLLPQVVSKPHIAFTVLINHMVFGLVVALVYSSQK